MKKFVFLSIIIALSFIQAISYAGVTVTANKTNIPRGQASVVVLNYQAMNPNTTPCYVTSDFGEFLVGSTLVGKNPKSITINIPSGSNFGSTIESLNIPVSVIEKAIKMKTNKIQYRRVFLKNTCFTSSPFVSQIFYITTEAAADFDIKRIELYFENRRAEITVPKNYKGLKAFADIKFTGSGLLRGYWEVDGRIISHVNQHITYGRTVTLQTPEIPPLPTFETGTHIVRFVITNPSVDIPLPSAIYFVTAEEVKEVIKMKLISPGNNSKLDYIPQKFLWEKLDGTTIYLIQFFEDKDSNPIFSAYTKEPFYTIPEFILKKIFQLNRTYYWKVIGFDESNNIIGDSDIWSFSFSSVSFVPNQIIIAVSKSDFSENFIENLKQKHKVEVIELFHLDSLDLLIILLKTEKNIFDKIEQIKVESKILFAQPNYIYNTFSEPMRKLQYALDMLKIEKLHSFFKGKGIKIAIIDTGVDYEHGDLKDRVVYKKNFVTGEEYKKEIHGTAVAGIIGASINGFGIVGIAPEADIYALRACSQISDSSTGICKSSDILKALDKAILKAVNVINMSFGTAFYDDLVASVIDKGISYGIYIVVSFAKINDKTFFPASHPQVISVGGIDEKGDYYPDKKSQSEAKIYAPAVNIFTTVPDNKHNFLSGTSFSSAHISGLLALYLEKGDNKKLPSFEGNLCRWTEKAFKISLCD